MLIWIAIVCFHTQLSLKPSHLIDEYSHLPNMNFLVELSHIFNFRKQNL